ncbi:MAG: 6-hydroxycyclohex-1-ene-1-carbonyl-CoA dehydrogenase [Deltaproteobacteria bacterium]|nr:6-hydroxycyclohex-1-ene-1-carbonyl-CoA dehydrogenase [Deltaproteobacteria bacterium]
MISYELTEGNTSLIKQDKPPSDLAEGYAKVKVAGCGLCHTDLSFIFGGVQTKKRLPLVLGHEISGIVTEGTHEGKKVIIPAVIPCGTCEACGCGNPRICFHQIMPGNDIDGGFAEFIDVPERELVLLPDELDEESLARHSVIADAVTTPLQAIHNLQLKAGDLAILIGCGGVGGFAALLALSYGATVIALDIDDEKLKKLNRHGVQHSLNIKGMEGRKIKAQIRDLCKSESYPMFAHKIFEMSGTPQGQEMAFSLINHGASVATVGFTMDKVQVRLSNLMAFDARIIGNWGADPRIYPEAVQIAAKGDLRLEEFTELYPLAQINQVIDKARSGQLKSRAVLVP